MDFKPPDSRSAVTCATFEPLSGAVGLSSTQFLLGFKDGTLALYSVSLSLLNHNQILLQDGRWQDLRLRPVSLGAMGQLHKAAMGGVTAATFIPGYTSRVVSIGHDGRCRLVDFANGGQKLRT